MSIHVERLNDWTVMCFRSERLTEPFELAAAERDLLKELNQLPMMAQVVLDFRKVEHASSRLLGLLLHAREHIEHMHGKLVLTRVSDHLRELLVMTKLDEKFTIEERLRDVVANRRRKLAYAGPAGPTDTTWID